MIRVRWMLLAVAAAGCSASDVPEQATPDSVSAPALPPVVPATVTLDDFRRLHWLAGDWRGFMADGQTFYERYEVPNDSTIVMTSYTDSTFRTAGDGSRITLRSGRVVSESETSRYVATRVDSTGADFSPERGNNAFTWTRESDTRWSATLRWTDRDGRPQTRVYALHRIERK